MQKILEYLKVDQAQLANYGIRLLAIVLFIVVVTAVINAIFRKSKKRMEKGGRYTGYLRIVRRILLAIVYIVGILVALNEIPVFNNIITSLLASSGIAAVVLSLACQEAIGNLASGLIILVSKPFQVGDTIRYIGDNITGTVESITLRHTVVRTFENKRLIIPNGLINKSTLENGNYAEDKICLLLDFSITYESDAALAMEIISDVVLLHPDYCDNRTEREIVDGEPPVRVLIRDFAESAVIIRAWVWAADLNISLKMKNDIYLSVQQRFKSSGIQLAYPHVELVLPGNEE
jgi:small conductance mechanosensitive channel